MTDERDGPPCAVCGGWPRRGWYAVRGDTTWEAEHGQTPCAVTCGRECFERYVRTHPGTGGSIGDDVRKAAG